MAFSLRKERPTGLAAPARSQEPQRQMPVNQQRESVKETRRTRPALQRSQER